MGPSATRASCSHPRRDSVAPDRHLSPLNTSCLENGCGCAERCPILRRRARRARSEGRRRQARAAAAAATTALVLGACAGGGGKCFVTYASSTAAPSGQRSAAPPSMTAKTSANNAIRSDDDDDSVSEVPVSVSASTTTVGAGIGGGGGQWESSSPFDEGGAGNATDDGESEGSSDGALDSIHAAQPGQRVPSGAGSDPRRHRNWSQSTPVKRSEVKASAAERPSAPPSQPLRTLQKLQAMLDETDYATSAPSSKTTVSAEAAEMTETIDAVTKAQGTAMGPPNGMGGAAGSVPVRARPKEAGGLDGSPQEDGDRNAAAASPAEGSDNGISGEEKGGDSKSVIVPKEERDMGDEGKEEEDEEKEEAEEEQLERLWTSKDRSKYKRQQHRHRHRRSHQHGDDNQRHKWKKEGQAHERQQQHQRQQQHHNLSDDDDSTFTDGELVDGGFGTDTDTDDGLGYTLPNLPVYFSDGEEDATDDNFKADLPPPPSARQIQAQQRRQREEYAVQQQPQAQATQHQQQPSPPQHQQGQGPPYQYQPIVPGNTFGYQLPPDPNQQPQQPQPQQQQHGPLPMLQPQYPGYGPPPPYALQYGAGNPYSQHQPPPQQATSPYNQQPQQQGADPYSHQQQQYWAAWMEAQAQAAQAYQQVGPPPPPHQTQMHSPYPPNAYGPLPPRPYGPHILGQSGSASGTYSSQTIPPPVATPNRGTAASVARKAAKAGPRRAPSNGKSTKLSSRVTEEIVVGPTRQSDAASKATSGATIESADGARGLNVLGSVVVAEHGSSDKAASPASARTSVTFDSIQKLSFLLLGSTLLSYCAVSPRTLPLPEYNFMFKKNLQLVALAVVAPLITFLCVCDTKENDVNAVVSTFYTSFTMGYSVAFLLEILLTTVLRLGVFALWEPSIFNLAPNVPALVLPWVLREQKYRPKRITLFVADFATSCIACPFVEEYIKLKVVQLSVRLPRNFRKTIRKGSSKMNNKKKKKKKKVVREAILRNPGEHDITHINSYVTQFLAASIGLKLPDTTRRILMYTKSADANKGFYAICRGVFPIHELCGTCTALALARRDVLGVHMPLWQMLAPAVVIHGMANFRGMKPIFKWNSSTPWSEMQLAPWNVANGITSQLRSKGGFSKILWLTILGRVFGYCVKNYYLIGRQAVKRTTTFAGKHSAFSAELAAAEMLKKTKKE